MLWDLELALDLGNIPRAYATWRAAAKVLQQVDRPVRDRLRRRLFTGYRLGLTFPPANRSLP